MATIRQTLNPTSAVPAASNGGAFVAFAGTNFPVPGLAFDASTAETVYFFFRAASYGSGNITATVYWYADTASSGDVTFGTAIAAITPNTDTQDIETKAFATAQTVTDSHLGTTGQRLHSIDVTISNLDSVAADDYVAMKLYRDAAAGSDTMTGDAIVVGVTLAYSDV